MEIENSVKIYQAAGYSVQVEKQEYERLLYVKLIYQDKIIASCWAQENEWVSMLNWNPELNLYHNLESAWNMLCWASKHYDISRILNINDTLCTNKPHHIWLDAILQFID